MNEAEVVPPSDDFKVAIICALGKEAEAVENLLNKRWKTNQFGRNPIDQNSYTAGRIGRALVVIVWLEDGGRTKAASATTQLLFTFKKIEHALVVGICGGVPNPTNPTDPTDPREIVLGDIVISTELQQYDVGKQYPNVYQTGALAKPRKDMRAFLKKLNSGYTRRELYKYLDKHLEQLLSRDEEYAAGVVYPGKHEDILHKPTHVHKHHPPSDCDVCTKTEADCKGTEDKSCSELNCSTSDVSQIITRTQRNSTSDEWKPKIHFGVVGSGDTVMKSAQHRDDIAEKRKIIAFEMEGAGVSEGLQSIVVIKGVSDYADSHKNKKWQRYAATMAAACAGAFLDLKEEEHGCEPPQIYDNHASMMRSNPTMQNYRPFANTFPTSSQLTRHATMSPNMQDWNHYMSGFPMEPYLARHASDDGGIALRPHQMNLPAERSHVHRTQSMRTDFSCHPLEHGLWRDGSDSSISRIQDRVSNPKVLPDATIPRSRTFPPQAHHQENTSPPAFPTLSSLALSDLGSVKSAEETARLLLEATDDPRALAAILADRDIDLNIQNSRGKTVAHLVLGTANVGTNNIKMLRITTTIVLLHQHQVSLDVTDENGVTPLHSCVKTGNYHAAQYLASIVPVNALDIQGRTPLYLLGTEASPTLKMAEILLRAGATLGGKKLPPLNGRPKEIQKTVRAWLEQSA